MPKKPAWTHTPPANQVGTYTLHVTCADDEDEEEEGFDIVVRLDNEGDIYLGDADEGIFFQPKHLPDLISLLKDLQERLNV